MKALAGFVVGIGKGTITVKMSTGNKRVIQTDKPFKYGDKVRVNFNFKARTVRSVSLWADPPNGTEICSRCAETHIDLGEDCIEDIYRD